MTFRLRRRRRTIGSGSRHVGRGGTQYWRNHAPQVGPLAETTDGVTETTDGVTGTTASMTGTTIGVTGTTASMTETTAVTGTAAGLTGKVAWNLLGLIASGLAQWAVIVILARHAGPAMLGQYALGLAISTPITLLASFSLRTVLVTDSPALHTMEDYLRLRIIGMLVALLAIALIAGFIGSQTGLVVLIIGVGKSLDYVGDLYFGLFQRHEQMRSIGISMLLNGAVTVLATYVLLVLTGSIVWATVGSVAGSGLGAVAYCALAARPLRQRHTVHSDTAAHCRRSMRKKVARRRKRLLVIALPLGIASGVASMAVNLPRYFVEHWVGTAALGTFAALGYVVLASNLLVAAIAQTVLPRMTRLFADRDLPELASLTWALVVCSLALGGLAVGVAAAVGGRVLDIVYGPGYADQEDVLVLLTAAAAISGATYFVGTALSAVRRFANQLVASIVTLTVTGVVGFLLIPEHGLHGAAWTVIAMMACDGALKAFMLRRALLDRSWA